MSRSGLVIIAAITVIATPVFAQSPGASSATTCDTTCLLQKINDLQSQLNDLEDKSRSSSSSSSSSLSGNGVRVGDTIEMAPSQSSIDKCVAARPADPAWVNSCSHGLNWRIAPQR
jgi:hypothetical protein